MINFDEITDENRIKHNLINQINRIKISAISSYYVGIKHCDDPKAFVKYSITMNHIYDDIDDYNPNRSHKILIVFDVLI